MIGPSSKTKILIVEDDEMCWKPLRNALEKEGFQIAVVQDGKAGLEAAKKIEPDLILLDILLPVMDGAQVLMELKKDPVLKPTPVIMFSSIGDIPTKVQLLEGGADDYVPKPFDLSELVSRIKALLRRMGPLVKEKRFSVKLVQHLTDRFERRGYNIYSSLIPSGAGGPVRWSGPLPDLLLEKGKKKKAISMESMESLLSPKTVEHWKKYMENPGVELIIAVHSRECQRAARMLRREYKVRCHVLLEEEEKKIPVVTGFKFAFPRFFENPWFLLFALCLFFAFLFSFLAGGPSSPPRVDPGAVKKAGKPLPPKDVKRPR